MVQQNIGVSSRTSSSFGPSPWCASQLGPSQRRDLSLQVLRRTESVTRLAARHEVSRKFVYQQMEKATAAIDEAFAPAASESDKILFWLPVTKDWLQQLVLSLTLTCPSPFRGVMELLDTMFDYRDIRLGGISNLLQQAVDTARNLNDTEKLSAIRVGAHDEIYQAGQPVLVGMDVASAYCYLHLLRFFLNHRRFPRSDRPERVGKSPAELLTGQAHPHWLEMLGYTRFRRN